MLGRPPGGRSRRGRGWTRTACTSHRCDRAGTSGPGCRRLRSHCRPTTRGSEKAETSPSGGREKGGGRGRGESLGLDCVTILKQWWPLPCPSHLYPGMAAEVEVKLCWMSDAHVHRGTCRDVATLANLVLRGWEGEGRISTTIHYHMTRYLQQTWLYTVAPKCAVLD